MEYLSVILTVALVHLLAVMSPGPDFIMITRNSLVYSRKKGIFTAIGLGLGIVVHVTYSLVGIGLLIAKSVLLFSLIKYLGAAYLIYIGCKSLISKTSSLDLKDQEQKTEISDFQAMKVGFLTNVTNPKATLFFLSLFTLVIKPNTPFTVKLIMGLEMSVMTALWFMLIAYLISHHVIKSKIGKVQHTAEKFIGVVLIALGVKVALSTSK